MKLRPRVEILVVDPVARSIFCGKWGDGSLALPGGGIDPGESINEAAIRESAEECGFKVGRVVQLSVASEIEKWSDSYKNTLPADRQQFDGSETRWCVVEFSRKMPNAKLDTWNCSDKRFRSFEDAMSMPVPSDARFRDMNEKRKLALAEAESMVTGLSVKTGFERLAKKAAAEVVESDPKKKKSKKKVPSTDTDVPLGLLAAPAGLGALAATAYGASKAVASDSQVADYDFANRILAQSDFDNASFPTGMTPFTAYQAVLTPGAGLRPFGISPSSVFANLRANSPLMDVVSKLSGTDLEAYKLLTDVSKLGGSGAAHYKAYGEGPFSAYAHNIFPFRDVQVPEALATIDGKRYDSYSTFMRKKLDSFLQGKLRERVERMHPDLSPEAINAQVLRVTADEIPTTMIPYREQVGLMRQFQNSLSPAEKEFVATVDGPGLSPGLGRQIKNYKGVGDSVIATRNALSDVATTTAGAAGGAGLGALAYYLLRNKKPKDRNKWVERGAVGGGALLGGAGTFLLGTQRGRDMLMQAASKLLGGAEKAGYDAMSSEKTGFERFPLGGYAASDGYVRPWSIDVTRNRATAPNPYKPNKLQQPKVATMTEPKAKKSKNDDLVSGGDAVFKSLEQYMRKSGADALQAGFLARLLLAGATGHQIKSAIERVGSIDKQASDHLMRGFEQVWTKELFEKFAMSWTVSKQLGGALGDALGKSKPRYSGVKPSVDVAKTNAGGGTLDSAMGGAAKSPDMSVTGRVVPLSRSGRSTNTGPASSSNLGARRLNSTASPSPAATAQAAGATPNPAATVKSKSNPAATRSTMSRYGIPAAAAAGGAAVTAAGAPMFGPNAESIMKDLDIPLTQDGKVDYAAVMKKTMENPEARSAMQQQMGGQLLEQIQPWLPYILTGLLGAGGGGLLGGTSGAALGGIGLPLLLWLAQSNGLLGGQAEEAPAAANNAPPAENTPMGNMGSAIGAVGNALAGRASGAVGNALAGRASGAPLIGAGG